MEEQNQNTPVPWLQRKEIGFLKAFVGTVKQVLFHPQDFFSRLDTGKDNFAPVYFCWIVYMLVACFNLLFFSLLLRAVFVNKLLPQLAPKLFSWANLLQIPAAVVFLYIVSAFMHLFVLLFRGKGGFKGTLNICAYASAAYLWAVIPFFGVLISGIWGTVVGFIGYKKIHKMGTVRTVFAFFVAPWILLFVCAQVAPMVIPNSLKHSLKQKMDAMGDDMVAQSTVRIISQTAEAYKSAKGKYPKDELELRGTKQVYPKQVTNGSAFAGYVYSLNLSDTGYEIVAKPSNCGISGTKIFTARTGGVISEEECKVNK